LRVFISRNLGKQAENVAYRYLKAQGLSLIIRNYACRLGEIDLIMQDKDMLVFIEVRYRKQHLFGNSLETVDRYKQNKLIKTAEHYLQSNPTLAETPCRFDVVGISPGKPSFLPRFNTSQYYSAQVEWLKNAFSR
jgi:putative endonuclease